MSASKGAAFTASRAALVSMLSAASRVAGNGKPIPALGSIWIDVKDGTVTWWATDTHVWRGGSLDVEVASPGSGLLPVSLTLAALKQCADGPVSLTLAARDATLKSGGFTAKLPILPAEDFPVLPTVPDGGVEIPGAVLSQMIDQVDPAIWTEHSNYFLRGAELKVSAACVQMSSTDGHRMARATAPSIDAAESVVVLPKAALVEVRSMLSEDTKQSVLYVVSDERHVFRVGSQVVIARAIDGQFPAVDRAIPKSWKTQIVLDRHGWLRALNRIAVVADVKKPCVKMAIADGDVVLTAESVDRGDAVERLRVEMNGDAVTFQVNPNYLRDFLVTATTETVACEVQDSVSAIVLKPIAQEFGEYVYVVMPMRL